MALNENYFSFRINLGILLPSRGRCLTLTVALVPETNYLHLSFNQDWVTATIYTWCSRILT